MADVVQVVGARELERTLARAGRELGDQTEASTKVAALVATKASRTAPRRTGRLAGAHRKQGARAGATVTNPLSYASVQHWGVGPRAGLRGPHNIRGRRWLVNAVDDQQRTIVNVYAAAVDATVARIRGAPGV